MIKSFMKKNGILIRVRMPVLISPHIRAHGHRHAGLWGSVPGPR